MEHGTVNAYMNHACRCDDCRKAGRAYRQTQRQKVRCRPTPASAHGTASGYVYWSCRCQACRDWKTAYPFRLLAAKAATVPTTPLTAVIEGDGAEVAHDVSATNLAVLGAISDLWEERGYAPSHREIAAWVGTQSPSHVRYCLRRLAVDGLIRWVPNVARAITLTDKGRQVLADADAAIGNAA